MLGCLSTAQLLRKRRMEDRGDLLLPPPHGGDVVRLFATPGAPTA